MLRPQRGESTVVGVAGCGNVVRFTSGPDALEVLGVGTVSSQLSLCPNVAVGEITSAHEDARRSGRGGKRYSAKRISTSYGPVREMETRWINETCERSGA
ncbi:hypothetical protein PV326_002165 [Microctonus aethiopoides]|uniref:Uncharacterized protein n=1 Tax=Microctonus aethiopoides TaxID=144406 RepID=A0AA39C623_9HYME|nr:hypothetical protein PV326_002165 [Microctonus aethiopoides]KAK0158478.1 hypothetical protein PV328_009475 [Microctonus aethiopoides]